MWFTKYRKFWVAAVGVLAVVGKVWADGNADPAEWGELAIAVATAFAVFGIPNAPAPPAVTTSR